MDAQELDIVPLESRHIDGVAPVLAEAFAEDPGTVAIVRGDRNRRVQVLHRNYVAQMDLNLRQGVSRCALLAGRTVGAAIISAPSDQTFSTIGMLKLLWQMLIPAGPAVIWRALQNMTDDEKHRPKEPNYYLETLGVDPQSQGLGIGSALLLDLIGRADREGVPVYLTTTQPRNISFYEKFGFDTKSSTVILGIANTHLVRDPRRPTTGSAR